MSIGTSNNHGPRVLCDDWTQGYHNIIKADISLAYQDKSCIVVVPCGDHLLTRTTMTWFNLVSPMNNKFHRQFAQGFEVGKAYSFTIEQILLHPELSKWKYLLTIETDNAVPPDGLLKLMDSIGDYDAIGGLYHTKGPGGMPMIYGKPGSDDFLPFKPTEEELKSNPVVACNGVAMGFTLYKMEMLRDPRLPRPLFETIQDSRGQGTQDLIFCKEAAKFGFKFAVNTDVRVGHYDVSTDTMW